MQRQMAASAALLISAVLLSACAGRDAPAAETDAGQTTATVAATEAQPAATETTAVRRYGVQSGIIHATTSGFGTGTVVTYFDDWGAKEAIHTTTEIEVMGITSVSRTVEIMTDGWQMKYDPDAKTGQRWRQVVPAAAAGLFPDLSTMTDATRAENGFEALEPRTYFGREVPGFSMTVAGMKIRGWMWENIPFRVEMDMGGEEPMVTEVTAFEEGATVPAEHFTAPADVVITEVQLN